MSCLFLGLGDGGRGLWGCAFWLSDIIGIEGAILLGIFLDFKVVMIADSEVHLA